MGEMRLTSPVPNAVTRQQFYARGKCRQESTEIFLLLAENKHHNTNHKNHNSSLFWASSIIFNLPGEIPLLHQSWLPNSLVSPSCSRSTTQITPSSVDS